MNNITCVVDARTLVDNIHEIKRWVYEGAITLAIPSSTVDGLEEQLQKASELKALHKSTLLKLASQRASQRVYPTFDINPLVVKDFIEKVTASEDGLSPNGVIFESLQRSDPSIEDAGKEGLAAELLSDQPTSFAQALLSKLNVASATTIASPVPTRKHHSRAISSISSIRSESRGPSRGTSPAKPDSSARDGVSPNGLPPSRNGDAGTLQNGDIAVPDRTGPLLSYTRSLIEKNRTSHTDLDFVGLLTDNHDLCEAARDAGIPWKWTSEIQQISVERKQGEKQRNCNRDTTGEVDALKDTFASRADTRAANGDAVPLTEGVVATEEEAAQEKKEVFTNGDIASVKQTAPEGTVAKKKEQVVEVAIDNIEDMVTAPSDVSLREPVGDAGIGGMNGGMHTLDGTQESEVNVPMEVASSATSEVLSQHQVPQPVHPEPTVPDHVARPAIVPPEDDSNSDDEVIVFNPRSKRLSQTKTSLGPAKTSQVPRTPRVSQTPNVPKQYQAPSNGGPALIDPDAFGRTFARKPSGVALNAGRTLSARSPKPSPRHSPHRSIATPEPADVDFVLKSGSPRGATRGKGKLWVP